MSMAKHLDDLDKSQREDGLFKYFTVLPPLTMFVISEAGLGFYGGAVDCT